jgi:hypothetical protein
MSPQENGGQFGGENAMGKKVLSEAIRLIPRENRVQ